jgi:hypothetical protein
MNWDSPKEIFCFWYYKKYQGFPSDSSMVIVLSLVFVKRCTVRMKNLPVWPWMCSSLLSTAINIKKPAGKMPG